MEDALLSGNSPISAASQRQQSASTQSSAGCPVFKDSATVVVFTHSDTLSVLSALPFVTAVDT
eukprot:SAG11_NODE_22956_length_397_cov_1.275168_2_plen_62_part_01